MYGFQWHDPGKKDYIILFFRLLGLAVQVEKRNLNREEIAYKAKVRLPEIQALLPEDTNCPKVQSETRPQLSPCSMRFSVPHGIVKINNCIHTVREQEENADSKQGFGTFRQGK